MTLKLTKLLIVANNERSTLSYQTQRNVNERTQKKNQKCKLILSPNPNERENQS